MQRSYVLCLLFFNYNIITRIAMKLLYSWIYLYHSLISENLADYITVQYCTVRNLNGNCSIFQQKLFCETSTVLPHVVEAVLS